MNFRRLMSSVLAVFVASVGLLLPNDAAHASNWRKCELPYTAFTVSPAGLVATASCMTEVSEKVVHHKTILVVDTDFAGGTVATATVSVGVAGSVAAHCAATDVFTGASNGWANKVICTPGYLTYTGPTAIIATLTTTVGNTIALTAGKVTVYEEISNVP